MYVQSSSLFDHLPLFVLGLPVEWTPLCAVRFNQVSLTTPRHYTEPFSWLMTPSPLVPATPSWQICGNSQPLCCLSPGSPFLGLPVKQRMIAGVNMKLYPVNLILNCRLWLWKEAANSNLNCECDVLHKLAVQYDARTGSKLCFGYCTTLVWQLSETLETEEM